MKIRLPNFPAEGHSIAQVISLYPDQGFGMLSGWCIRVQDLLVVMLYSSFSLTFVQ